MNLLSMVKFEFKTLLKTPNLLLSFFGFPAIFTLIIGYLTQNSFGGGISSYEYYSIVFMIFIYSGAGVVGVFNFMDKPIKQGNLRTIFTPVKTLSIYLSQIISGTIYCTIAVAFTMVIFKVLFKLNYNGNQFIIFMAMATLVFMSNALGIFLCTVIDNVIAINMIYNMLQGILTMLGGAFFSMEKLGKTPAILAKLSPIRWIIDGILNSMYDSNNSILSVVIVVNVVLVIILIAFCSLTFKTEKYI